MHTIFCIVGKSGSGKDTIVKELEETYTLKSVSSLTTRAMREGEVEGEEHKFISKLKFFYYFLTFKLSAWTRFSGNYYGATKQDVLDNNLYVIDMKGVYSLKRTMGGKVKIVSIYIDTDICTRISRMKSRGDSEKDIQKRLNHDTLAFAGVKNKCDFVVNNDFLPEAVSEIYDIIEQER